MGVKTDTPPGLTIYDNSLGFVCIRLHYVADPDKNPDHPDPVCAERARAWLLEARRSYPDPNDWEREMEINFFVGKGTRVFPQFTETVHCQTVIPYARFKTIYRAWDFGWHCPICLVIQVDPKERLLVLHEFIGSAQTTREFGEHVVDRCARLYPNHGAGYVDYCDPAGQQVKSIESERNERRDVEVLNGIGIFPTYEYGWSRKDGRTLIHQLLALRHDQTPGLFISQGSCPLLVQAFLGQYVYPERKLDQRIAEEPNDDEHPWGDLIAALRYGVTGLHTKLGLRRLMPMVAPATLLTPALAYHGYGSPVRSMRSTHGR